MGSGFSSTPPHSFDHDPQNLGQWMQQQKDVWIKDYLNRPKALKAIVPTALAIFEHSFDKALAASDKFTKDRYNNIIEQLAKINPQLNASDFNKKMQELIDVVNEILSSYKKPQTSTSSGAKTATSSSGTPLSTLEFKRKVELWIKGQKDTWDKTYVQPLDGANKLRQNINDYFEIDIKNATNLTMERKMSLAKEFANVTNKLARIEWGEGDFFDEGQKLIDVINEIKNEEEGTPQPSTSSGAKKTATSSSGTTGGGSSSATSTPASHKWETSWGARELAGYRTQLITNILDDTLKELTPPVSLDSFIDLVTKKLGITGPQNIKVLKDDFFLKRYFSPSGLSGFFAPKFVELIKENNIKTPSISFSQLLIKYVGNKVSQFTKTAPFLATFANDFDLSRSLYDDGNLVKVCTEASTAGWTQQEQAKVATALADILETDKYTQ